MSQASTLTYVQAAAALMDLPMDEARLAAVAAHFERTAAMARLLEETVDLSAHDEPVALYSPAPFPEGDIA